MKSSRRSNISSFLVMDVMREASLLESGGKSIIHMEVGQPSTGGSPKALKLLSESMFKENLGYSVALGLPELREAIADLYHRRYGLSIDPERVIVTAGSSAAFVLAFISFFDKGDGILIGEPGYPSYKNILKALNLKPIVYSTSYKDRYNLIPESLFNSNASGVLVASPANPTGQKLYRDELESLIETARAKDIVFISDEIYHGLSFVGDDVSALEFDENAIVINSFSKYFSMTGWRVGWMVVPPKFVRTIERIVQNLFICPPHPGQVLALNSMDQEGYFEENRLLYKKNRSALLDWLPNLGFKNILPPDGSFYLYADITDYGFKSEIFVRELLHETGIAITPGTDFDSKRGDTTVRFSFACSYDDTLEAIHRISKWRSSRAMI